MAGMVESGDHDNFPWARNGKWHVDVQNTGKWSTALAWNIGLIFPQLPIEATLAALVKTLYDRELSISENRVKPASILHNSSLIMGRQIINVLPEG